MRSSFFVELSGKAEAKVIIQSIFSSAQKGTIIDAKQFRTHQMLLRVAAFETQFRRDFAPGSNAAKRFDDNTNFILKIEELEGAHAAAQSEFPDQILGKEIDVSALRAQLKQLVASAQRVFGADSERAKKIRIPKRETASQLILDARALRQIGFAHKSAFLAQKMPADFLENIDAEIAQIWSALRQEQGEIRVQERATPNLNPLLKNALANVRLLDAPIAAKYAEKPEVLAQWENASQIDFGATL